VGSTAIREAGRLESEINEDVLYMRVKRMFWVVTTNGGSEAAGRVVVAAVTDPETLCSSGRERVAVASAVGNAAVPDVEGDGREEVNNDADGSEDRVVDALFVGLAL